MELLDLTVMKCEIIYERALNQISMPRQAHSAFLNTGAGGTEHQGAINRDGRMDSIMGLGGCDSILRAKTGGHEPVAVF